MTRTLLCLVIGLSFTSCRKGMVVQQHLKPLAEERFFENHSGSRIPPEQTVARGQLRADEQYFTGRIGEQLALTIPMPVTPALLARGRERFDIYCSVCHGRTAEGNGMIAQRGFPNPPSFHDPRLRKAPIGYFFYVMTNGYGVMFSYASRVPPEDRWAIAAYIRALQLSQNAGPSDLDSEGFKQLWRGAQ